MRICWSQWVFVAVVGTLSLGQIVTACGNKRPLYLPDEKEKSSIEKDKKSEKKSLTEQLLR